MQSTVEDVKNLLTNTEMLTRFIIESDYTSSDDPDYPASFWAVKRFNYRINMEKLERPTENDWKLNQSFQVKTLEEAVAHCILGTTSSDTFVPCPLPENLKDYWSRHRFIIKENISSKIKWDEKQINRSASFELYDYIRDNEIKSYEGSRWKINYLLTELPSILSTLGEGLPYGFSSSDILKKDPVERYPWFMFKHELFESTHYIHDQKCICGNSMNKISNYSEEGIKVEVWSVEGFFKRNIAYINNDRTVFCNGITKKLDIEDPQLYINDNIKKQICNLFPEAERYNSSMESGGLKFNG